uniref:Uncharacterized protein n=1 Tax=Magnetococcus massalia (strain MO-1) TaxID=451514 RepID=A0A1S7LHV9_MAGMO|nr:Exported protein of unknown function. Containing ankyrin repeat-containing domain [Candidatus Magnetococcus massalia]
MRQLLTLLFIALFFTPSLQADESTSPLIQAIQSRDHATVKQHLSQGADPNAYDAQGWAAIHHAVGQEDPVVINLLAQHGADLNRRQREGLETPLIQAVQSDLSKTVVEALLIAGADPNKHGAMGFTALHIAAQCRAHMIDLLIKYGAQHHKEMLFGLKPLGVAIAFNQVDSVSALLRNGTPIKTAPQDDKHLLQLSKRASEAAIHCLIEEQTTLFKPPSIISTEQTWHRCRQQHPVFQKPSSLLNRLSKHCQRHFSPLLDKEIAHLKKRLEQDPEYAKRSCQGVWPILVALYHRVGLEKIHLLMHSGASIIGPVESSIPQQTGLKMAVQSAPLAELSAILASMDPQHLQPRPPAPFPLELALCQREKARIALLLESRIRLDSYNNFGDPLFFSMGCQADAELIQLLYEKGVDLNRKGVHGQTLAHMLAAWGKRDALKRLKDLNMIIDREDDRGWTLLHYALFSGNLQLITDLAHWGVDFAKRSKRGQTAHQLARLFGYDHISKYLTEQFNQ